MSEARWPSALDEIVTMFAEAPPRDKLDFLLEFSESLPDLPPELAAERAGMEQVHECQSPVFLHSALAEGRVRYFLDAPREAPTVRGFASILAQGLDGATPAEIAATPLDLYEQMGLNQVLSPQRLRGLTALLQYMKRQAQRHAAAQESSSE